MNHPEEGENDENHGRLDGKVKYSSQTRVQSSQPCQNWMDNICFSSRNRSLSKTHGLKPLSPLILGPNSIV